MTEALAWFGGTLLLVEVLLAIYGLGILTGLALRLQARRREPAIPRVKWRRPIA